MWNSIVSVPDHCLFICYNKNESYIFITFVISLLLQNLFSYWLLNRLIHYNGKLQIFQNVTDH